MHPNLHLLRRRQDNAHCADCRNPNPQWASLSFAVFLCLQCAGVHRGFGVHISFVRSLSMDAWQPDQLSRMQLGGNAPFADFVRAYAPPDQGGYSDGIDPHALYHCWAASQYREKLDYALAGKPWAPSSPPSVPARPSSAQGLRKSRASARSPATHSDPPLPSANEAYFASLGLANAARPADLPPSQGGRYQGFGSSPSPSEHLTSAAAPSLADFQNDPAAAFTKGWSLFSSVVTGASRVVNENVIQPGMERVMDPNLHASVRGYVSEAHRRAQVAGQSINDWSKLQLSVDVADHVTGLVDTVRDKVAPAPSASSLALHDDPVHDDTNEYSDTAHSTTTSTGKAKKNDDWDEWHDF